MPESSLEWIKDIEITDLLQGDLQMVDEWCGRDFLIALWTHFSKVSIYVSEKPLAEARRRYIRKYSGRKSVKEFCRILECSERFVYETLSDKVPDGQGDLFAETKEAL